MAVTAPGRHLQLQSLPLDPLLTVKISSHLIVLIKGAGNSVQEKLEFDSFLWEVLISSGLVRVGGMWQMAAMLSG